MTGALVGVAIGVAFGIGYGFAMVRFTAFMSRGWGELGEAIEQRGRLNTFDLLHAFGPQRFAADLPWLPQRTIPPKLGPNPPDIESIP